MGIAIMKKNYQQLNPIYLVERRVQIAPAYYNDRIQAIAVVVKLCDFSQKLTGDILADELLSKFKHYEGIRVVFIITEFFKTQNQVLTVASCNKH